MPSRSKNTFGGSSPFRNPAKTGNGGIASGGAIYNTGTLIVAASVLTNNQALAGFGGTNGSGGSLFAANGQGGGGASAAGGGIFNSGMLVVTNCSFITNSVAGGASQGSGNGDGKSGGAGLGGAIFNSGTLIAGNSTFFANPAQGGSGGNGGNDATFPGNGGNGGNGAGGAIYTSLAADLLDCTLADGLAAGGTNGFGGTGGGAFYGTDGLLGESLGANLAVGGGTATLRNTILAYPAGGANASGSLTDNGHNLSSDTSAAFKATGSTNNVDPLLQAPANNGGTRTNLPTMALFSGSPAIAAGNPGSSPSQDERGFIRSASNPTIGAYEFNSYTVEGAVFNTNTPLAGVIVNLGLLTTTTDTNGNYSFSNLVAGTYTVRFSNSVYTILPSTLVLNLTQPAQTTVVLNSTGYSALGLQLIAASAGGATQLLLSGTPSGRAVLQASTDFTNWTALATNTLSSNGQLIVSDPGATNYSYRFYRVRPAP